MEKQLPFDMRIENSYTPYRADASLNPSAILPILVEDDGTTIRGSYPIVEYLEDCYPEHSLLGEKMEKRNEVRRLVDWFDSRFHVEVTAKLLYEKVFRRYEQTGAPDTRALREGKQNIGKYLDYISTLTQEHKWLAGETLSLADITAAAHISALDYLGDIPWKDFPECKHWYSLMKSRPVFQIILQDRVAGISPPPYYQNPDF